MKAPCTAAMLTTLLVVATAANAATDSTPRHLVLISIDTLRADYIAAYGHPYVRTPHIDALAASGILFEQHVSAAPTTLASHTALMTGTWPHTHGVPRNGFEVHASNLMLAEVLKQQGFVTGGVIGAFPLSGRFGFDQGFDHFDERLTQEKARGEFQQNQRPANEVTDAALDWVGERGDGERLFLFVHYFDVHAPYEPPGDYARLYRQDDSDVTGGLADVDRARKELGAGRRSALQEQMKQQYAAGVTWVDSEVGRLIEGLEQRGILESAVVVLTSDHGEAMDEHWEHWNHGFSTYEEALRTPLIVKLPGGATSPRRVADLVSNIDVMPSVLELLGIEVPEVVEGRSFSGVLRGEDPDGRRYAYGEATKPFGERFEGDPIWKNARKWRSVRDARWKLMRFPLEDETQLFDLRADPGERTDVHEKQPEQAATLLEALKAWDARAKPKDGRFDIDPEVLERLEALGYGEESLPERSR